MKKRGLFLIIFVLILLICSGFALGVDEKLIGKEKHMKLLAVQEKEGAYQGSIADLYLELKEGSGRVFLETFPLTKMDTQISTRFAKEIACDYFNLNCGDYDFIYTIKAESNIVGGPSAGAAIAALTTIALLDLEYSEDVTITGMINSGGTLGPVGGVKEKLEAAAKNNLSKVLIVKGGTSLKERGETIDLIKFAKENLSLNVVEVEDLNEVIFHFTGQKLKEEDVSVEISSDYQKIMKELADLLCNRTKELMRELEKFRVDEDELKGIEEKKNNSENSIEKEDYYSAASFCFGANILIKELIYNKEKKGMGWMISQLNKLEKKTDLLEKNLEKEQIETISDLQVRMVVKERLDEVKEMIEQFGESEDKHHALAYAEERFFSAISWSYFFEMKGKVFVLDEEKLKESCMEKISESEERYQYVELLFGGFEIGYIRDKIDKAAQSLDAEEHELCLMKAAQAKAEANAIINAMSISEEDFMGFLETKKEAVEKVIAESDREDVFPILGYSYYQYANSLRETEKESALLYLEYSLEMSGLDIYFEEDILKKEVPTSHLKLSEGQLKFIEGLVLGALVVLIIVVLIILLERKLIGKKKKAKAKRTQRKK